MDFKSSRLPSSSEDLERYWKYAVQENTDFTSIVINRNAVDFTKSVDYFNLTDKEADEVSFAGRNVEFFSHPVSLKEFELNIFRELNADTQIGVLLSNVNRLRTEAEVYGMYVTFSYIGKSVYCAITICLVDKDFGMEMETAVIEIGQDEEPYILPLYINEEALDYFTCDDIAKLSYWLGNFWVGIQYKMYNRPEEVKIIEQRGPISPNEEPVRKEKGLVLIRRIIPVDKDGNEVKYSSTGSGRKYSVPAWGVRGHERILADGRVVHVSPYRKGKERNNPDAYAQKEYRFVDKKEEP